jgi:GAF domain-containing protein/HAMP domain-containing protein
MTNLQGLLEKMWQSLSFRSLPIRNRLIRGSIAIVFLAVSIMGIFVYFRTRQTNLNLISRLETTTQEDAENTLNSSASRQAEILSSYFNSLSASILSLRGYEQNLLSQQTAFGTGSYWDAERSLSRNDKGSWDNPNSEIGSVYIPAASELTNSMISELNSALHMDLIAPTILEENPDVIAVYFGGTTGYTLYYPNIDLAAIVPADFDVTGRPWYVDAAPQANPGKAAVWSDPYLDAALNGIVITNSAPVYDARGEFRGVVAQDIQLTKITEIVTGISIGDTGYAFLIDQERRLIAMPATGYEDLGIDPASVPLGNVLTDNDVRDAGTEFNKIIIDMTSGGNGFSRIQLNDTERFVVYRSIEGVNFSLAIIVPAQEMLARSLEARQQLERENINALVISVFVILGLFVLTLLATLNFSNNLTKPLTSLTKTAEDMATGNLNARVNITEQNEFGTLAAALNSMASSLKESIETLEVRVADRTAEVQERSRELEIANKHANRRAAQFEALAQVAQSISSIRDPQELLPRIANVISQNYGFYHVGIFLKDELNEFAVFVASNSEGGKRMLERKHRLRIGEEGIVGKVTATGEPRIALDVGSDAVYFGNPDLPNTHSEMALPLRSSGRIIGALDVQSTETGAFTNDDVQTLSLLADQVSLAIENARLFENSNRTLNELQLVMRQTTREAWKRLPEQQKLHGFRYSSMGAFPLEEPVKPAEPGKGRGKAGGQGAGPFVVPIELRGEVIGSLVVQPPAGATGWNEDQQDLIRAVAERVALSAENARLFEETTARAERERLVSEITGKIRSHNDPQTMIETAMRELRNALGATRVEIIPKESAGKDKV